MPGASGGSATSAGCYLPTDGADERIAIGGDDAGLEATDGTPPLEVCVRVCTQSRTRTGVQYYRM